MLKSGLSVENKERLDFGKPLTKGHENARSIENAAF